VSRVVYMPATCTRCQHSTTVHTAGVMGRCTEGYCECPWFQIPAFQTTSKG